MEGVRIRRGRAAREQRRACSVEAQTATKRSVARSLFAAGAETIIRCRLITSRRDPSRRK